jgi:hypothetical protein
MPGMWAAAVSVAERERKFLTVGTAVVKPEEVKTAEDEARETAVIQLKMILPVWDNLRDDPRFHSLLRRMNFPE